MISANSSSLIHFTKRIETLKLILTNGLRYSYAFESVPHGVLNNLVNDTTNIPSSILNYGNDYGIALPMVSFCDIPLTRAFQHSKLYGKYGIGIEKDFMLYFYKDYFNPVVYTSSDALKKAISFFSSERLRTMDRIIESTATLINQDESVELLRFTEQTKASEILNNLPSIIQNDFNQHFEESYNMSIILALYKPYKGVNYLGNEQVFYDEREWRAFFPHADESQHSWFFPISRSDFLIHKGELNKQISKWEEAYITIPQNCLDAISHIIVKNENQRDSIIDFILKSRKLFGYPIEPESKLKYKIISKISSFEKAQKDY